MAGIRTFAASFGGTALRGPRHLPSTPLSFFTSKSASALAQFLAFLPIALQNFASASHNPTHTQHSIQVRFQSRSPTPFFHAFLAFFEVFATQVAADRRFGSSESSRNFQKFELSSDTKCMRYQGKSEWKLFCLPRW